jgi:DNA-binding CsgD family transcriptional regulator
LEAPKSRDEHVTTLLEIGRTAGLGATFQERMAGLVPLVSRLIPRARVAAAVHDQDAPARLTNEAAWFFAGAGVGPGVLPPYLERYQDLDPMRPFFVEASGRPRLLSETDAGRRYGQDPFTGEFLAGLGIRYIMLVVHRMPDGSVFSVALHRGPDQHDFDANERALLAACAPDLARAASAAVLRRTVMAHISAPGRSATVHAVVFDTSGRVVHADLGAAPLLDAKAMAQLSGEIATMVASRPAVGTVIERDLSPSSGGALPARVVALDSRSGIGAMAVLSHEATDSRFERLVREARLTGRERQVAALAIEGLRNRDIANRLGVGVDTVKWHLKTIFQKTKVHGRGGLAAIVLGRG